MKLQQYSYLSFQLMFLPYFHRFFSHEFNFICIAMTPKMLHKALQEANLMFPEAKVLLHLCALFSVMGLETQNEHLLSYRLVSKLVTKTAVVSRMPVARCRAGGQTEWLFPSRRSSGDGHTFHLCKAKRCTGDKFSLNCAASQVFPLQSCRADLLNLS